MLVQSSVINSLPYASRAETLRRVDWNIDRDVIRGREFDFAHTFLPEGLSFAADLDFLGARERRLLSQVQGRTYANMTGLLEHFIGVKFLESSRDHARDDPAELVALLACSGQEARHRQLFGRIEDMIAAGMPAGYAFFPHVDEVEEFVLARSTWAVLALTCQIERFTQVHYCRSIAQDSHLSSLYKDAFFFHWKDESQRALVDEREWLREDAQLDAAGRDAAVNDLIELLQGIDALLLFQADADADYFAAICERPFTAVEVDRLRASVLAAYRFQFIASGLQEPHFADALRNLISAEQAARMEAELAAIIQPQAARSSTAVVGRGTKCPTTVANSATSGTTTCPTYAAASIHP